MSRISVRLRGAAAALLFSLSSQFAHSQAPESKISPADLAVMISAYVDGVVELRQFNIACGAGDPKSWEEGAAVLVASLKATGLAETAAADFAVRLGAVVPAPAYDCAGEIARLRLVSPQPTDWIAYHTEMLNRLKLQVVTPAAPEDPRLDAVHAVFDRYLGEQTHMLNCMALVEPSYFTIAYADWNDVLDKTEAVIREAGYDAPTTDGIVEPARAAKLLSPPPVDRQAAIAGCVKNTEWMAWYSTFNWFGLIEDVRRALAGTK